MFTRARLGALSLKKITASAKTPHHTQLYGTNNRLLAELETEFHMHFGDGTHTTLRFTHLLVFGRIYLFNHRTALIFQREAARPARYREMRTPIILA